MAAAAILNLRLVLILVT